MGERKTNGIADYPDGALNLKEGCDIHPYSSHRGETAHYCYDSRHTQTKAGIFQSCLCKHARITGGLHCGLTGNRLIRHEHQEPPGTPVDVWIPCDEVCGGVLAEYFSDEAGTACT